MCGCGGGVRRDMWRCEHCANYSYTRPHVQPLKQLLYNLGGAGRAGELQVAQLTVRSQRSTHPVMIYISSLYSDLVNTT